jgi:hypothetical protein
LWRKKNEKNNKRRKEKEAKERNQLPSLKIPTKKVINNMNMIISAKGVFKAGVATSSVINDSGIMPICPNPNPAKRGHDPTVP